MESDEESVTVALEQLGERWSQPAAFPFVINTNEEGHQAFVFPRGMAAFADKYDADVIQIYDDTVIYYHGAEKVWKHLEDQVTSSPAKLTSVPRGKLPNTPVVDGTPE